MFCLNIGLIFLLSKMGKMRLFRVAHIVKFVNTNYKNYNKFATILQEKLQ